MTWVNTTKESVLKPNLQANESILKPKLRDGDVLICAVNSAGNFYSSVNYDHVVHVGRVPWLRPECVIRSKIWRIHLKPNTYDRLDRAIAFHKSHSCQGAYVFEICTPDFTKWRQMFVLSLVHNGIFRYFS